MDLTEEIEHVAAESRFSGVVRIDDGGAVVFDRAYGWAHRGHAVANTSGTRFGIASGTKGLTALTVVSLIDDGQLDLSTTARSVLGADLPLIDDDVTVEHLLVHRSGIGDYLDENAGYDVNDYVLPVPVHQLDTTEQYLRVLEGFPTLFPAGVRFAYCNSGYVVLALIAERVATVPFHDLVDQRVCRPAGMLHTGLFRSDDLPAGTATGYLSSDGDRTNVLHLPVRGSGDGGLYSTAADIQGLWTAFFAGRIVSPAWVTEIVRPRSDAAEHKMRYGLGFWRPFTGAAVILEGCDAGVSFRTVHDPVRGLTHTVLSNTSDGAWPVARRLRERLGG